MRYLCISEWSLQEIEKVQKCDSLLQTDRETNPGKYPRKIGDEYFIDGSLPRSSEPPYQVMLGLTIYESDSQEQMARLDALHAIWASEVKTLRRWLMPIIEGGSVWERLNELRKLKATSG